MIKDGTNLVIGGPIEARKEKKVNRVPILSKIPPLGFFLKSVSEQVRESQLAIFLPPHRFGNFGREGIKHAVTVFP
ncbi:MAG: hypothetical protein ABII00_16735 [Elusimicrobiota bacterium]